MLIIIMKALGAIIAICLVLLLVQNSRIEKFTKQKKVIISMTTIPTRIDNVNEVCQGYLNQSRMPDEIHLNIPHVFKRNNTEYDISRINVSDERVKIHRCDDLGPMTKIFPTVEREFYNQNSEDIVILYCDDDVVPPHDFVERYMTEHEKEEKSVIFSWCGDNLYQSPEDTMGRGCRLPEAFQGVLLPLSAIDDLGDFTAHVKFSLQNSNCFRGDDYVLADYYTKMGIPRRQLEKPYDMGGVKHIDGKDALGSGDGITRDRYKGCIEHLKR